MANLFYGIGGISVLIGASISDSDSILPTVVLIVVGAISVLAGNLIDRESVHDCTRKEW